MSSNNSKSRRKRIKTRAIDEGPIEFEFTSGNVFADLGLSDPDERLAKSKLAMRIAGEIRERGITQAKAGELMGIDQGKVSRIVRGRLKDFSTDRLLHYLKILGNRIEIRVTKTGREHGELLVV